MDNIITVSLGILLAISEILPYIKQIRSNGITEFLVNKIIENLLNTKKLDHPEIDHQETDPLLHNDTNSSYDSVSINQNENVKFSSNLNDNIKKLDDEYNININSENVLLKFNTSNVQISFDVNDKNSEVS
jgi:hypothetical protein